MLRIYGKPGSGIAFGPAPVDLKQLTALITVSEVGSVTRAAKLLHLVQPAVTRQIRTLEEEVGVPLFERTGQGMVVNEAGKILVERARRALRELDRARAEIQPDPVAVQGIVTVGLLESTVDILASPLIHAVAEHFPRIELRILTAYSGHLQQWLDLGDVDLSLLYNLTPSPSISATPLLVEQLWAVASPGSGLCVEEPVPWSRLWEEPLILPVPGHGLRVLIDQACHATGAKPRVHVETNSMQVQLMMAADGLGWTVLPAAGVAQALPRGRLSAAPLSSPEVTRAVVLGLPRGGRIAPPVEAVARELLRLTRRLVHSGLWPSAELSNSGT